MRHISTILKHTIQELQMELSSPVKRYFNLYCEVFFANENLPKNVDKFDRDQLKNVTTSIFIDSGGNDESTPGHTKSGKQTEETWDGTETIPFGEHKGKEYIDVPLERLEFYAEGNDPKYPNKAQWEIDRRMKSPPSEEDYIEPSPDDDERNKLPF